MRERTSTYEGDDVEITFDRKLCIHVGECGRSHSGLFDVKNDPWCSPNAVASADAVAIVERCPTGALTYERRDGGPAESAPPTNEIVSAPDGPLYAWGELQIQGQDGGSPFRAALCRCGQSANKPFCDNSHKAANFKDSGAVGQAGAVLESAGGPLKVTLAPNGPLLVNGAFSIRAGTGRVAWTGTKAALCRCGQSKNKPFCDGAHKDAEFEAD